MHDEAVKGVLVSNLEPNIRLFAITMDEAYLTNRTAHSLCVNYFRVVREFLVQAFRLFFWGAATNQIFPLNSKFANRERPFGKGLQCV